MKEITNKIGKAKELGVIPNREIFIEYQLGDNPQAFFIKENETLVEATETIQANFTYFELAPTYFKQRTDDREPFWSKPNTIFLLQYRHRNLLVYSRLF